MVIMQSTQMCPIHLFRNFIQTLVLLMALFPTSKVWALAPQVQWRKIEAIFAKICAQFDMHLGALASIPMLVQGFTRFENSILSPTQSVTTITNNIASVEQVVGGLAARVAALEAGAASASSVSGSARSWPSPGLFYCSTAAGSHGPKVIGRQEEHKTQA